MIQATDNPPSLQELFPWPRGAFDPPDLYAWLREERPVVEVKMSGGRSVWLVTRYEDVRSILADPRVSADANAQNFPELVAGTKQPAQEQSFLRMDEPAHNLFRRMLAKNFMVKRLELMRPSIQTLVDDQVSHLLSQPKPADFVREFALPIPSTVISWILGVPVKDGPFFNRIAEDQQNGVLGTPEAIATMLASRRLLNEYLHELVAAYEAADEPGDHVVGQLITEMRAGNCTRQDIVNTSLVLLIAGHDTTANMTAMGALTLLQHPEQMAELKANPEMIPDAIEELLRYLSIVHLVIARVAKEDIDIGGTTIPAGAGIYPLNFSANRDGTKYPDPDTFDTHRAARDHVAFGFGVHQCLGQPLARIELRIIFETLLRRVPSLKLVGPVDELPFRVHSAVNGLLSMPVTW
jgi:cytochrome P450